MTQARDLADGKFDTNTLVVDAANNRVGVGLTTPERVLHVNAGTNNNCALFESTDTNADIYLQDNGATGNTSVGLRGQSNDLVLITNGSETARLLSGGGLTFNGDTAATNALDDYEEGDFDPTISSGFVVTSYDNQKGHYVKIGNQVTAWVRVEWNASSRNSGQVKIAGLPFSTSNDSAEQSTMGGFITYQKDFSNTVNIAHQGFNSTEVKFYELDGSTLIGSETSGASAEIRVCVTYTAA